MDSDGGNSYDETRSAMIALDHDKLYSLKGPTDPSTRMAISPQVNSMRLNNDHYGGIIETNSNSKTPTLSSKMDQRKETNLAYSSG